MPGLHLQCWDYKCAPPCSLGSLLEIRPGALYMPGRTLTIESYSYHKERNRCTGHIRYLFSGYTLSLFKVFLRHYLLICYKRNGPFIPLNQLLLENSEGETCLYWTLQTLLCHLLNNDIEWPHNIYIPLGNVNNLEMTSTQGVCASYIRDMSIHRFSRRRPRTNPLMIALEDNFNC